MRKMGGVVAMAACLFVVLLMPHPDRVRYEWIAFQGQGMEIYLGKTDLEPLAQEERLALYQNLYLHAPLENSSSWTYCMWVRDEDLKLLLEWMKDKARTSSQAIIRFRLQERLKGSTASQP